MRMKFEHEMSYCIFFSCVPSFALVDLLFLQSLLSRAKWTSVPAPLAATVSFTCIQMVLVHHMYKTKFLFIHLSILYQAFSLWCLLDNW